MVEKLKELRELWGWSQAFVAEMLRISRSTLSRWERGQVQPRESNEEKLAALIQSLEKAAAASGQQTAPDVELHVGGDVHGNVNVAGRDQVGGDVITTTDGTSYVIKDSLVIVVTDPEELRKLLSSQA
jgi:transcriptional regulator with XRE-family HTH domain